MRKNFGRQKSPKGLRTNLRPSEQRAHEGLSIRIITCNVPENDLLLIDKMTKKNGIYPSRSELIRVAVREYLIREMAMLEALRKNQQRSDNTGLEVRDYNTLQENANIFQSSRL